MNTLEAILKAKQELPEHCSIVIYIAKDDLAIEVEAYGHILEIEPTGDIPADICKSIQKIKEYVED